LLTILQSSGSIYIWEKNGVDIVNFFKIGDTNFGIGEIVLKIENGIISNLTITGNEDTYKQITADESGYWYLSTLNPPKIYFRELPLDDGKIEITDELLDEYDIALYFNEHNDLYGTLAINDKYITIKGEVNLWGSIYPLEIIAEKAK
jgi:hypothetical protein